MKKSVLITGASGGIGRATARKFAAEGYDLYLMCHKNKAVLSQLEEELQRDYEVTCYILQADVGSYEQVKRCLAGLPAPDVLINNAGIAHYGLLSDISIAKWQQLMATNVNGMFYVCREIMPGMIRKKSGRIINISSVWGITGASMEVAYSASKGAVNAFTKALAKELAPSNIQVNGIAFGMIETDMNARLEPEEQAALQAEIPMGRFAAPAEAGRMIWQTAHLPEYVTGQIITMDGGWVC